MKSLKSQIRSKIKQAHTVREISEILNVPIDYVALVFLEFKLKNYEQSGEWVKKKKEQFR